ncbi:MAG: hypothetical protein KKE51_00835 [Gammaproteobacteria bacterium]|nr:hypothetical protein [Gammaproteobacteria bacterium]MBU1600536.1 hypothetical protein [Gammaproteobacteria bacterium]MBU2434992.1 hypothetical protein [Gammaproteobacteria bacterium]MBU2448228.1 hypothetical protein [Gammaproteobacteria bacterium]
MWRRALMVVFVLAAGCAEVEKQPDVAPEPPVQPETSPVSSEPKLKNSTLKYLAKRNLKPMPTRPLNVRSRCSHKDAVGTQTRLDLLVKEASVKTFKAEVSMKGHGTCRFNLNEFDQVEKLPQALLRHKTQSGCLVRMWEQGPQVTIAFNSCAKSCDGQAFDYLWPIMVEAKSGQCF